MLLPGNRVTLIFAVSHVKRKSSQLSLQNYTWFGSETDVITSPNAKIFTSSRVGLSLSSSYLQFGTTRFTIITFFPWISDIIYLFFFLCAVSFQDVGDHGYPLPSILVYLNKFCLFAIFPRSSTC